VTPYELLGRFPDRTRPFITAYDGPDLRVELSVASAANAVAKAAGLLRDDLGLEPGATVSLDLPRHWQLPVWTLAALTVGARCGRSLPGTVDVRLLGPAALDRLAAGEDPGAHEVLVASCDAFGMPVPSGVPRGVLDVGVEVRSQPDVFGPDPAAPGAAGLVGPTGRRPWTELLAAGPPRGLLPGQRLWVGATTPEAGLLEACAIVPLLLRGSVVLGAGLTDGQAARIRQVEAVQP